MSGAIDPDSADFRAFWAERHLVTLTTLRADGSPHVVPVGATWDEQAHVVRIITSGASVKVRNIRRGGERARVAVCQVDGRRWVTVEGTARVLEDDAAVADAERRYAQRYKQPRENPRRVVIEVPVTRVMGNL